LQLTDGATLRDVAGQSSVDGFPGLILCKQAVRQPVCATASTAKPMNDADLYSIAAEWDSADAQQESIFGIPYKTINASAPTDGHHGANLLACYNSEHALECVRLDGAIQPPADVTAIYRLEQ
jgi:hypothetical protein